MESITMFDLATVSAVVAALVTVIGNAFNIDKKYRAILAIFFACVLSFMPTNWSENLLVALVIGLTASGVYSQVKPREFDIPIDNMMDKKEFNKEQISTDDRKDANP